MPSVGLPRGWTRILGPVVGLGNPSATVNGIPGVSHVLQSFDFKAFSKNLASDVEISLTLDSNSGTYTGLVIARLVLPVATSATAPTIDSASVSLLLMAQVNESITLTAHVNDATTEVFLLFQGYDV